LFFKDTDFISNELSNFRLRGPAILSNKSVESGSQRAGTTEEFQRFEPGNRFQDSLVLKLVPTANVTTCLPGASASTMHGWPICYVGRATKKTKQNQTRQRTFYETDSHDYDVRGGLDPCFEHWRRFRAD